jgi:hypothetical protein
MDITNNDVTSLIITRVFTFWLKSETSQKIDRLLLNGVEIWDISDTDSPSDIPTEGDFKGAVGLRTILIGTTSNFVIQFQDPLQPTGYEAHIVFGTGCQVKGTK